MKIFIKTQLRKGYIQYGLFSVFTALIIIFTVLPTLPNVHIGQQGLSLMAAIVGAEGGDAGAGDPGSGGDAGGAVGGDAGAGDPGSGAAGDGSVGGDVGAGDPGPGCCGDAPGGDVGVGDVGGDVGAGDPGPGCCGDAPGGDEPTGPVDPGGPNEIISLTPPSINAVCVYNNSTGKFDIELTWGAVSGASSYQMRISNGMQSNADGISGTSYTFRGLTSSGEYAYWGESVGSSGTSATSAARPPVTCVPPVEPVPGSCLLRLYPDTVTRGDSATLRWTSSNLSSVRINPLIGAVASEGSITGSLTENTTFVLTGVDGRGSAVTCTATLTVLKPVVPEPAPTCDAFTATPQSLTGAGSVVLNWGTSNATNVSINNGVGTVLSDGSRTVSVNNDTNYVLTASRGGQTVTCSVSVDVRADADPDPIPSCDAFTISPTSLRRGETATLTWATSNTSNVSINQGIGQVVSDGTRTVTINDDTTFILTATRGSVTRTCQTQVQVEDDNGGGGGGGGGSNSPRCTLKASDTRVKAGERVTLTWRNTNTNDIRLEDDRGRMIADSRRDNDIDEDRDEVTVRPTRDTEYTLTAFRGSKKRECTVEINVDDITVTGVRSRDPLVAGISLSNVPYTGFDAGPFLTTVFYTLLALWALAVAYILVMRRGSVFGMRLNAENHSVSASPLHVQPEPFTAYHAVSPTITESVFALHSVEGNSGASMAPTNLPVGNMATPTAPRGYDAYYETGIFEDVAPTVADGSFEMPQVEDVDAFNASDLDMLEAHAHDAHVLMSTSALHFIMAQTRDQNERLGLVDMVITAAKANFPKEDGWIVVNKERILELLK